MNEQWDLSLIDIAFSHLPQETVDNIFMNFFDDELMSLLETWRRHRKPMFNLSRIFWKQRCDKLRRIMSYIDDYLTFPTHPTESNFDYLFHCYNDISSGNVRKREIISCPIREVTVEWILGSQFCIYQFQNESNQLYIYKGTCCLRLIHSINQLFLLPLLIMSRLVLFHVFTVIGQQ